MAARADIIINGGNDEIEKTQKVIRRKRTEDGGESGVSDVKNIVERNNFLKDFYKREKHNQAIFWQDLKKKYEGTDGKPMNMCAVCKILYIPRGLAGKGTIFKRTEDARLLAICEGRDGIPVCPGLEIKRDLYLDRATVTQELKETGEILRKNLKHIRDRVLATNTFDDIDKTNFKDLTEEYQSIRILEENYKEEMENVSIKVSKADVVEDEIMVPDAYFGNTEGIKFSSPMIIQKKGKKEDMLLEDMLDIKMYAICKDDLPVKVLN
jgi:hypothetical protein